MLVLSRTLTRRDKISNSNSVSQNEWTNQYEQFKQQPPLPFQNDNKQMGQFYFSERKNPVKRINFWKFGEWNIVLALSRHLSGLGRSEYVMSKIFIGENKGYPYTAGVSLHEERFSKTNIGDIFSDLFQSALDAISRLEVSSILISFRGSKFLRR